MSNIDTKTKEYMSRTEVFADVFNHYLYDGQTVIQPDHLREMDTTEVAVPYDDAGRTYPVQKFRDILKSAVVKEDENATYILLLGVENQAAIHNAMPVKNMVYDALNYAAQVNAFVRQHRKEKDCGTGAEFLSGMKKGDRLLPVVTLVVYYGQEKWDGPMSLHEMLAVQHSGILRFVPDYRINLLAPISMELSEIKKFQSDFRQVAAFIRYASDKKALEDMTKKDEGFRHMDFLTASVVNDVAKAGLKMEKNAKGEVDMCLAIKEMMEDSLAEGMKKGMEQGLKKGMEKGMEKGIEKGKKEGINVVIAGMQKLLAMGRGSEIQRFTEDEAYRMKVMEEFGLKYN